MKIGKVSKESVGFENPAKGPNHCSQCVYRDPPLSCRRVRGVVRAGDWCKLFKRKP